MVFSVINSMRCVHNKFRFSTFDGLNFVIGLHFNEKLKSSCNELFGLGCVLRKHGDLRGVWVHFKGKIVFKIVLVWVLFRSPYTLLYFHCHHCGTLFPVLSARLLCSIVVLT